jgi:hypothetical protein
MDTGAGERFSAYPPGLLAALANSAPSTPACSLCILLNRPGLDFAWHLEIEPHTASPVS